MLPGAYFCVACDFASFSLACACTAFHRIAALHPLRLQLHASIIKSTLPYIIKFSLVPCASHTAARLTEFCFLSVPYELVHV